MLYRELLTDELNRQSAGFKLFAEERADDLAVYLEKLGRLSQTPLVDIFSRLAGVQDCGALPSGEFETAENFSVKFAESWANHEEARGWAFEILKNRTTFAADGSQLFAEREVSLPVAAIQIGWFENPHNDAIGYEKNARFFVLSPEELLRDADEPVFPETRVGQRRFEAEIEKAKEFLEKKKGWRERGERMPLAFYDGTLLLSISLPKTDLQEDIINRLVELVRVSKKTEVPLIGFVDRSYARDLLSMLDAFDNQPRSRQKTLDDVSVILAATSESRQILKNWGDRTVFCYSKRRGLKAFIDAETEKSLVGFVYLQTTADSAPARLDIPAWIYEQGLLDEVLDAARAECVIGLGYPYALEAADATAVITMRDREIFLRALQDFAMREKLQFSVSRKAASKGRRR